MATQVANTNNVYSKIKNTRDDADETNAKVQSLFSRMEKLDEQVQAAITKLQQLDYQYWGVRNHVDDVRYRSTIMEQEVKKALKESGEALEVSGGVLGLITEKRKERPEGQRETTNKRQRKE
ncbi:hypothetical protein FDECE_4086 [Fusarium decemcellulare]|nr:hypothetical protein FDECE_4086 [Fusarium decemcellulare]